MSCGWKSKTRFGESRHIHQLRGFLRFISIHCDENRPSFLPEAQVTEDSRLGEASQGCSTEQCNMVREYLEMLCGWYRWWYSMVQFSTLCSALAFCLSKGFRSENSEELVISSRRSPCACAVCKASDFGFVDEIYPKRSIPWAFGACGLLNRLKQLDDCWMTVGWLLDALDASDVYNCLYNQPLLSLLQPSEMTDVVVLPSRILWSSGAAFSVMCCDHGVQQLWLEELVSCEQRR